MQLIHFFCGETNKFVKIEGREDGTLRMSSSNIEGDMKRSLLDRPDAEKVFQPWWDLVEDYLLNSLLALGNSG